MSARQHGQPLWFCRPVEIDGNRITPLDDEGHVFVGSHSAMMHHICDLESETRRQWAATEIEQ